MGQPPTKTARTAFEEGLKLYRKFTATDNARARALFKEATTLDPNFSRAHAMLSATHRQDWILAWSQNLRSSEQQAYDASETAVQLARTLPDQQSSLPQVLLQQGFVYLYQGKLDDAIRVAREATGIKRDFADGYALEAHALIYKGEPKEALERMNPEVHLDPNYPFFYDFYRGHAYYVLGFLTSDPVAKRAHFEKAVEYLRNALRTSDKGPNFRPARSYLVAALSELGRRDDAIDEMIKVRSTGGRPDYLRDPKLLAQFIRHTLPYKNEAITARLIELWQDAEKGAAERTGTTP